MWLVGFRDLIWRRRRFLTGVLATALVFAITLLLSGLTASMQNEAKRTIDAIGADAWVVPVGVNGPFTSTDAIPASLAAEIAAAPGVRGAAALVFAHRTVHLPALTDLNVIGYDPGSFVKPPIHAGRSIRRDGEIVVDSLIGRHVGDHLRLGKRDFTVVGTTTGLSYLAGTAASFVTLRDAQSLLYAGQPLASTIVTRGVPASVASNFIVLDNAQARSDLRRPVRAAASTIGFLDILLWGIAAGIIGAILYMSALERTRDFAVLKATGSSNRYILAGLGSQAIVLSLIAAAVAIVLSFALAPLFPMQVEVPAESYPLLVGVSIVVGVLASIAGLRRALSIDPALAFGG